MTNPAHFETASATGYAGAEGAALKAASTSPGALNTGDKSAGAVNDGSDKSASVWSGDNHPLAGMTSGRVSDQPALVASAAAASAGDSQMAKILPSVSISNDAASAASVPAPIEQAISQGAPVRFSSSGENAQANRQPDYFMTPEGKFVANPKATPSADGSINVEVQSKQPENNKSLRDAITHETENQKQAAKEMIRLFQKAHPGQATPSWMNDLANAQPNLPDFVPFNPAPNQPAAAPPENGFAPRGVGGGGGNGGGGGAGDGGSSGFSGNGGFDNNGYFKGNGGAGDGSISTGRPDAPLGPGEQVQAKQLYDYFTEHGFSAAQASGILGNIQTESSFRTDAHNTGEGAIGLCQWEGGRRVDLERFAAGEGKPVTDWHVQADFIMHELNGKEGGAMAAIKHAETPEQAAVAFQSRYERSASLGDRAHHATNLYHQMEHVKNA